MQYATVMQHTRSRLVPRHKGHYDDGIATTRTLGWVWERGWEGSFSRASERIEAVLKP